MGHRSIFNSTEANQVSANLFKSIRVYPSYIDVLREQQGDRREDEETDGDIRNLENEQAEDDPMGFCEGTASAGAVDDAISDEGEEDYTTEEASEDEDSIESEDDDNSD